MPWQTAGKQLMLDRSYDLFFNHVISLDEKYFWICKHFAHVFPQIIFQRNVIDADEAFRQIQIDVS